MKIEEQVCTIEQSKILNRLGVKVESYFYWHIGGVTGEWCIINWEHSEIGKEDYHAYTVSELGEIIEKGTKVSEKHWQWLLDCVNSGLSSTVCYNVVALAGYVITQIEIGILNVEEANKRLKTNVNRAIIIKRAWSYNGKKSITFSSDLIGSQKWGEFKKMLVKKLGKDWGHDSATTLEIKNDIGHFTYDSFEPLK